MHIKTPSGLEQSITSTIVAGSMPIDQPNPSRHEEAQPVEVDLVTEAKLIEVANSEIYHDAAFLKFLQVSKEAVGGDTRQHRNHLKEKINYLTVCIRKIKQVYVKEIVMVSDSRSKIWHLSHDTLTSLKYNEVDVIIKLIEQSDPNSKSLHDDLRNGQPSRLPEVIKNPWTIIYQSGTRIEDIDQLVIPQHLTPKNHSIIIAICEQLQKKKGRRTSDEVEAMNILRAFIATGKVPEKVKSRRDKDNEDKDRSDGREKQHRSNKDGEDKEKKDEKKKKGDDNKERDQVYGRRSTRQQALSISDSTPTNSQDILSRVDAIRDNLTNSKSTVVATNMVSKAPENQLGRSSVGFHKHSANGLLHWSKSQGFKLLPGQLIRKLKMKSVGRKKKESKSKVLAIYPGLKVTPLDEDYDEEALAYLKAQSIHYVAIVNDCLELKYTSGEENKWTPSTYLHQNDLVELERVMVLLKYENEEERKWKLEIAHFIKTKRDYEELERRENAEKMRRRDDELRAIESKANEMRAKGLCRVKFNPYTVEYRKDGKNIKIRMDYLNSYPEASLKVAIEDLAGSPLIEELCAREELMVAIEESARRTAERNQKRWDDLVANLEKSPND